MHVSVNKCELLAEQIVTDVAYSKAKFNPDDFKLSNGIENEYNFLQEFYKITKEQFKENNNWNDNTIFWIRDYIAYILWYEINVKNSTSEAMDYARPIVKRKWKQR